MPRWYTVAEVAEVFRKSRKTIWRWLEEGKMFPGATKVKDGYLIPDDDVEDLLVPRPHGRRVISPGISKKEISPRWKSRVK